MSEPEQVDDWAARTGTAFVAALRRTVNHGTSLRDLATLTGYPLSVLRALLMGDAQPDPTMQVRAETARLRAGDRPGALWPRNLYPEDGEPPADGSDMFGP